jgi:hypothetical protein
MPPLLDLPASAFTLIVEAVQFILSPANGGVHVLPK